MELTILGSGTCVPSLERGGPANLLKIGGKNIVIDLGPGTLNKLFKAGISYKDIDIVLLTHFHSDHVSELNSFIQALNWTPKYTRKKDLVIIGPVGLKKLIKQGVFNIHSLPNTYKIKIKEIKHKIVEKKFVIKSYKTPHSPESLAYKFEEKGKSLVISGDTDFDEGLINFSKNTDVLLLECSFPNNMKMEGHLIPKECGLIAEEAKVKKLVLTHLYPTSPEIIRLKQTKKIFKSTILARDLMKIEI